MKVLTLPPSIAEEGRSMRSLQNRWYNCFTEQLALDKMMFQIGQPASPIAASDLAIWNYQNIIPPNSLTYNRAVAADSFFAEYTAFAIQMQFPASTFEQDIGAENFREWSAFLVQQVPPPAENQIPALFLQWAMVWAPDVAQIGASDLSRIVLINAEKQALAPYLGPQPKPPDFLVTYQQLLKLLSNSARCGFSFRSAEANGDVSCTWTGGRDSVLMGLWEGSSANSRISQKFAQSSITADIQFKALVSLAVTPGSWYNSAIFQLAYSNQTSPPWPPAPNPCWSELFGPHGSMPRLPASLIAVDGIEATILSDGNFSIADQKVIRDHLARGVWPFYAPDSTVTGNAVIFDDKGTMNIRTVTQPGNPLFLGVNVLSTPHYLGHILK